MKALFEFGYQMAVEVHEWQKHPPVLVSGVDDDPPE